MVFIDMEKVYDKVLKNVLWWALHKEVVPLKYVSIIRDMYEGVVFDLNLFL